MKYIKNANKKELAITIAVVVLSILTLVFAGVYSAKFYTMVGLDRMVSAVMELKWYFAATVLLVISDAAVLAVGCNYYDKKRRAN